MRVLFYLPAVTPWWFERIILPLMEKLSVDHEVHILAPIFWQGTGIMQQQYDLCAHLPDVAWHIVTDEDHKSMRVNAVQRARIADFVSQLNPDFVLCRSADFETPAQFPGIVRHITEGGADPLLLPVGAVHFAEKPFDHGLLPPLEDAHKAQLSQLMEPYWGRLVSAPEAQKSALCRFRKWAGLPDDRPVLFMPLEYEHKENFYIHHRVGRCPNARLVEDVLASLDGRAFLALTNHPLNELYVDNSALKRVVAANQDHVTLIQGEAPCELRSTSLLMRCAEGVLLGDSKSYALAGFCGTPIIRQSRFATGEWLNAYDDFEAFIAAIQAGNAARPDAQMARIWFAYHAANNLVSPRDPGLTGSALLERLTTPFDSSRWERNIAVFAAGWATRDEVAA